MVRDTVKHIQYICLPLPRIARVPHTSKLPEACPHCGSHVLTRRGTRKKKLEIVQLWRCASCKRVFTPGPAALHNKTYPLRMILSALTDYNTGYTLHETAARLKKKTNRSVSPSTITTWLDEYKQHCTYRRLRAEGLTRFPAESDHPLHQALPSPGLRLCVSPTEARIRPRRDARRQANRRHTLRAARGFPGEHSDDMPARSLPARRRSEGARVASASAFADVSRIIVNRKENAATQTAALIIPAVGNNKLRHETLQRFMLANDSVTVAIEIPIWLTETDIAALEKQHGIELAPQVGAAERTITGHIDFLQVRNGAVHILDYKPDARTNKPIAQLAIYALALTRLVPGLKLFDIKCAWFNEHEYCEIFPRLLFSH